ncbi:aconitate hydratase AcnA [Longimicrobium sp.]|uniref:aconitate hydratase AcnA n=1 Tax=Longimicrobium sp. TaxID=2029185 RepID=UPI002E302D80|nr:aconitate hydratase AcnA [Longimicrobium sp.]HEX6039150.1 aconitate hydratase AcnA [Longimicrobium sp.]
MSNSFGARSTLSVGGREYRIFRLDALNREGVDVARLPYSLRILLENLLRLEDGVTVTRDDILALARWDPASPPDREIAYTPARVVLQDFTGVPCVVDLAAMRDAMAELGGDPGKINPLQPVELVIDHSIQVDAFGTAEAFEQNVELDYQRNAERYAFLRWGQQAFQNFQVVPPNTGIVHQVNLEYLSRVVFSTDENPNLARDEGMPLAYPDTCVGTDSHTPMVNGLGILAWGVGGIEAEAAMLGQPISMLIPEVIGFRLEGELPEGATATDLVLTVTEMLRKKGVVGKFVEFYGPGIASLALADRATIGNMSPEYGATCAIFPPDQVTLDYLRFTGRPEERIALVEAYMKEQGLFHSADSPEPVFTDTLTLDLNTVQPSVAGPRRPQDRINLSDVKKAFAQALPSLIPSGGAAKAGVKDAAAIGLEHKADGDAGVWGEGSGAADASQAAAEASPQSVEEGIDHGSVVIAAITSCTNTSNPSVMMAAGLLAKKAREHGLSRKPWVKTSLAPGSKVVTEYYEKSGTLPYLEALGFNVVGYGCTTCIGNSGPLPEEISKEIQDRGLVACSVLSGNRNFEGRINSDVRANFLMSPPLVVAYAIAGRIDWDPYNEPIGEDAEGRSVFLKDIWPTNLEVASAVQASIDSAMYARSYGAVFEGDDRWKSMPVPAGDRFEWADDSTYVRQPPYFENMGRQAPESVTDITAARAVAVLGDSVTTDHISPAGSIKKDSPAGKYLVQHGVDPKDFNSYGARRGNHEVMIRGTFANVRIRNQLAPGTEGGFTTYFPQDEITTIYDAAMRYQQDGTPLMVLAGKEYGSGSSRDWAAKGPYLQGIKAVIAESYERIHRSNLVGMGILPLQFMPGENVESLGLSGRETFDVVGVTEVIGSNLKTREVTVRAAGEDGATKEFRAHVRIDTPQEVLYYRHGGILQYVLRQLLNGRETPEAVESAAPAPVTHRVTDDESKVAEGSQESFPASDPPAY